VAKQSDPLIPLPKLNVLTVYELLRATFGGFFAFANQINSMRNVTVTVKHVSAVFQHSCAFRWSSAGHNFNPPKVMVQIKLRQYTKRIRPTPVTGLNLTRGARPLLAAHGGLSVGRPVC
jgi:hypothetical protein